MRLRSPWSPRTTKIVLALVVVALLAATFVRLRGGEPDEPLALPAVCSTTPGPAGEYSVDPVQARYATEIAAVARRKGLPARAVTIAIATALQESQLYNLPHGDRDSLGLFQQRPSQGWGTPDEILTPRYAIEKFFEHLVKVPNWQNGVITEVAQAVQRSGFPQAYAQWEQQARSMAQALTGQVPAGFVCKLATPRAGPQIDEATAALTADLGTAGIGEPVATDAGWTVACWLVGHAHTYHLTSVRFAGHRWDRASGVWAPDPTADDQVRL